MLSVICQDFGANFGLKNPQVYSFPKTHCSLVSERVSEESVYEGARETDKEMG